MIRVDWPDLGKGVFLLEQIYDYNILYGKLMSFLFLLYSVVSVVILQKNIDPSRKPKLLTLKK